MGEGGARVLQVANERDQDKRNGCRALLAVHDGETGVAILVVALGGVEERSDEVLRADRAARKISSQSSSHWRRFHEYAR